MDSQMWDPGDDIAVLSCDCDTVECVPLWRVIRGAFGARSRAIRGAASPGVSVFVAAWRAAAAGEAGSG